MTESSKYSVDELGAGGLTIPAGTLVRVEGFPFLLTSDTVVDGVQGNLDLAMRLQHTERGNPNSVHFETDAASHPPHADTALRDAKDAKRLDWLDQVNRNTNAHYGTKYGWKYDINHNRACLADHNLPALTVREAIDEAMKEALARDTRGSGKGVES